MRRADEKQTGAQTLGATGAWPMKEVKHKTVPARLSYAAALPEPTGATRRRRSRPKALQAHAQERDALPSHLREINQRPAVVTTSAC